MQNMEGVDTDTRGVLTEGKQKNGEHLNKLERLMENDNFFSILI